jgi:MoxR-like ATPase
MIMYYHGNEICSPPGPTEVDTLWRDERPENYVSSENLAAAVNVALILGKPLLLTGEPGTGKTRLADHVAMALGLGAPERFNTKSTSQATDLFYRFDSLARFHAANLHESGKRALDFVTFGPLGNAILRTLPRDDTIFDVLDLPYPAPTIGLTGSDYPRRCIVLIDEIDKAPRDFPNDLLDSIDNLRFSIRELESYVSSRLIERCGSVEISARNSFRPLVIITSNSEKNLPDPFLRRCVYFNIPFPDDEQLRAIVARRVGRGDTGENLTKLNSDGLAGARSLRPDEAHALLNSAIIFFEELRNAQLRKRPSTAELIDWLQILRKSGARSDQGIGDVPALVHRSLGVLVKSFEDLTTVYAILAQRWPTLKRHA